TMFTRLRRARALCALALVLGSAMFAWAQSKATAPARADQDAELPSFPIAASQPRPTPGLEVAPVAPVPPAAALPRLRVVQLPRSLAPSRKKVEALCEQGGGVVLTAEEFRPV